MFRESRGAYLYSVFVTLSAQLTVVLSTRDDDTRLRAASFELSLDVVLRAVTSFPADVTLPLLRHATTSYFSCPRKLTF
ncbi:hypothetical protein DFH11DRAFT_1637188 [Phellopilus nigrolimitatus]|nr:hypothetical protein DFH11DRAFT_1637188 [Phellopilus nigrolimitatus]